MLKDHVYVVFGLIRQKIARCPCIAWHTIITNPVFSLLPTPIKDSVGDDGGEEACSAGRAADGAVLLDLFGRKYRRVVEIEIRVEIET